MNVLAGGAYQAGTVITIGRAKGGCFPAKSAETGQFFRLFVEVGISASLASESSVKPCCSVDSANLALHSGETCGYNSGHK